ncbi:winged helix-turn-helix transcriptional regulator [Streptomyces litchfieldiae]|uniref:Helix-turn-helix domain-containing protein n=1 Tax=Streptomyces litchfieldiae TaxID=3075543 RepID=A0ABU2MKC3_9ACTN|nr:helix-turn-helix domain-containing protein [Streptomyces sp. DSM 44938]MDT0342049.1 helix-turn-helix domain-containing protein [Streptomyces sp. DSM 44938]
MGEGAVTMPQRPYSCGIDAAIDVVGGKWKVLILWALHDGERRFGELRRSIPGVSEKVLIQQLRELEADEIVHREVFREVPPRVEYSLTEFGVSLNRALGPLGAWGKEHKQRIEGIRDRQEAAAEAKKTPAPCDDAGECVDVVAVADGVGAGATPRSRTR